MTMLPIFMAASCPCVVDELATPGREHGLHCVIRPHAEDARAETGQNLSAWSAILHVMAETPAGRLLALLEILQSRPVASGAELADAIGVTERSLRRYVQRLVDLGIPVESERGPYGGYRLRPRYRLPPLMLTAEEAVAVTLGLLVARPLGVGAAVPAAASAMAKLQRVLPDAQRERVQALSQALGFVLPFGRATEVDAETLTELGAAAGQARQVRLTHRSPGGRETTRVVDPYGVVYHAGRWYLVGHDHLREDLRTFRIDRVTDVARTGERFSPPEGFDAVGHLVTSLAAVPYPLDVEVILDCDVERAQRLVPATVGTVQPHADGALLRIGAASAEWAAHHLVTLGVGFTVVRPEEVRQALRDLAAKIVEAAMR
jgi:predicted DNA-binding transcriptional regulator YafY